MNNTALGYHKVDEVRKDEALLVWRRLRAPPADADPGGAPAGADT